MIVPFQRAWFRNPWFVVALLVVAVIQWHAAIERIRDIQATSRLQRNLDSLTQALRQMEHDRAK